MPHRDRFDLARPNSDGMNRRGYIIAATLVVSILGIWVCSIVASREKTGRVKLAEVTRAQLENEAVLESAMLTQHLRTKNRLRCRALAEVHTLYHYSENKDIASVLLVPKGAKTRGFGIVLEPSVGGQIISMVSEVQDKGGQIWLIAEGTPVMDERLAKSTGKIDPAIFAMITLRDGKVLGYHVEPANEPTRQP